MCASVVVVIRSSASTRARIASLAACGWRNVATNASSASYQSWLPGIAYTGTRTPLNGNQKFVS